MLMHRRAILRKISRKYSVTCDAVDESKIRKDYAKARTLFNERNSKNPEYPCISLKARYATHLRNIKDTDSEGALQDHFRKDVCGSVDNITVQLLHRLTPRSNKTQAQIEENLKRIETLWIDRLMCVFLQGLNWLRYDATTR